MANNVGDNPDAQKAVQIESHDHDRVDVADVCRQALFEANPMGKAASAEASMMPSFGGTDAASAALPSRYFEAAMAQLSPAPRLTELSMANRFSVDKEPRSLSTAIEPRDNVKQIQTAIARRNTMLG